MYMLTMMKIFYNGVLIQSNGLANQHISWVKLIIDELIYMLIQIIRKVDK